MAAKIELIEVHEGEVRIKKTEEFDDDAGTGRRVDLSRYFMELRGRNFGYSPGTVNIDSHATSIQIFTREAECMVIKDLDYRGRKSETTHESIVGREEVMLQVTNQTELWDRREGIGVRVTHNPAVRKEIFVDPPEQRIARLERLAHEKFQETNYLFVEAPWQEYNISSRIGIQRDIPGKLKDDWIKKVYETTRTKLTREIGLTGNVANKFDYSNGEKIEQKIHQLADKFYKIEPPIGRNTISQLLRVFELCPEIVNDESIARILFDMTINGSRAEKNMAVLLIMFVNWRESDLMGFLNIDESLSSFQLRNIIETNIPTIVDREPKIYKRQKFQTIEEAIATYNKKYAGFRLLLNTSREADGGKYEDPKFVEWMINSDHQTRPLGFEHDVCKFLPYINAVSHVIKNPLLLTRLSPYLFELANSTDPYGIPYVRSLLAIAEYSFTRGTN